MKKTLFRATLLLLAAFLAAGSLCACQKEVAQDPVVLGDTYVKDGITQNSLLYMDNVYYKNGSVHYSIVNQRSASFGHGEKPDVEKWDGEKWRPAALYTSRHSIFGVQPAYSTYQYSFAVNMDYVTAGEYRLVYGYLQNGSQDKDGRSCYVYDPERTYVIGYLSIPESEEVPAVREPKLFANAELVDQGGMHLHVTLENKSTEPIDVPLSQAGPSLYYHTKSENRTWFEYMSIRYQYLEDVRLDPGKTLEMTLPLYEGKYDIDPIPTMEEGRYRVYLGGVGVYSGKGYSAMAYFDYPTPFA